jgi:hypothetical protein
MHAVMPLVFIAVFWITPVIVAKSIGDGKGRTSGWVWGLVFGWLGVLVVALQSPARTS